ncbi:prolipoprotein diacylglyceryl transferase [Cryobacterium fucosi]|uniref:Phosphatidylglycerol--prolipoprotein diacylglyceryl transferase n=1 Tax=Cryobacterium fucosi TaxID=1259157 RepID=A0A4R9BAH6_9MICO|nr:prolipoprotein diacylglyceryl transferase [Cryobacterium fucosi]TFD79185.1 prolipoprotein diacylglyceryl transferase [Cryobacterium fucosi]
MTILTSIPSPDISSFQVGPFQIHFYALFILTGIVVAVILTSRRLTRRGGEPGIVLDITLWAVPLGIIGGRLYHVVTHPTDYFFPGADLWKTLYVWEGGLAIFGAILFGGLGAYLACRRAGLRFLSFADALAPGMLLAQSFGRLGNYFNQELFGTPTTLPWGLQINPSQPAFPTGLPAETLFHPLFLYEILWNLVGVIIVLLAERQYNLRWGKTLGLYLIIYGVGRTWFESFRLDPTEFELLGFKINMITAAAVALVGLILIIVQSRRHTVSEPSPYLPGRQRSSLHRPVTGLPPTSASTNAADAPTSDATGHR